MDENKKIVQFWDDLFKDTPADKIEGKWVSNSNFNNAIKKYIKEDSNVLDYGCGTGWALIEIGYTVKLNSGLGIDPSRNAYDYLLKTKELSGLKNLEFKVGNQDLLKEYKSYFDSIVSINVIDVIPDDILNDALIKLKASLKDDGYLLLGINPDFPFEILKNNGYEQKGSYLYKDDILRGNLKTKEEWIDLFEHYFEFVEYFEFALTEREKQFPRRMFILKNKVSQ